MTPLIAFFVGVLVGMALMFIPKVYTWATRQKGGIDKKVANAKTTYTDFKP